MRTKEVEIAAAQTRTAIASHDAHAIGEDKLLLLVVIKRTRAGL